MPAIKLAFFINSNELFNDYPIVTYDRLTD